jgi:hypothetical protein
VTSPLTLCRSLQSVIHGDLNPSNVLLKERDACSADGEYTRTQSSIQQTPNARRPSGVDSAHVRSDESGLHSTAGTPSLLACNRCTYQWYCRAIHLQIVLIVLLADVAVTAAHTYNSWLSDCHVNIMIRTVNRGLLRACVGLLGYVLGLRPPILCLWTPQLDSVSDTC